MKFFAAKKLTLFFPLGYNKHNNFKIPKREKEKNMKKAVSVAAVVMLVAMLAVCLVACAPKNPDAAQSKMEKAGYTVLKIEDKDAEGCQGAFSATKGLINGEGIFAFYFDSKDSAKKFVEDTGKWGGKELQQSGKWAYAGTEAAIKEFLK